MLRFFLVAVVLISCSKSPKPVIVPQEQKEVIDDQKRLCGDAKSGEIVSRIRYKKAEDGSCLSEVQTAICNDGVVSTFSGTFELEVCKGDEDLDSSYNCRTNKYGTIAHNESITRIRYEKAIVADKNECKSEQQLAHCKEGILGEWSGRFTYETCKVGNMDGETEAALFVNKDLVRYSSEKGTMQLYGDQSFCFSREDQPDTIFDGWYGDNGGSYTPSQTGIDMVLQKCNQQNVDAQFIYHKESGEFQLKADPNLCIHKKGLEASKSGDIVWLWPCDVEDKRNSLWDIDDKGVIRLRADSSFCLARISTVTPQVDERSFALTDRCK